MLELKKVSVGYEKKNVLSDVDLSFEKGKLTCIIGENGCGKSTLLKAALGILPLLRGEITLEEKAIASFSRNDLARRIAYLSQGKNTPDMCVEQMVLHGRFPYLSYPRRYREEDRKIARQAMDTMGILPFANVPLGELSGGMRQKAYIAMALAQDTDYILFDEPTTYLDISHQIQLMQILRELAESGKGIVAVMHELPLVFRFSDAVAVIGNGHIRAFDTPLAIYDSALIREVFGVSLCRSDRGEFFYGNDAF